MNYKIKHKVFVLTLTVVLIASMVKAQDTMYVYQNGVITKFAVSTIDSITFHTPILADTIVVDVDGNVYPVVVIGTQIWMAANLATTKYNDSTNIPLKDSNTAWAGQYTPAYCWYADNEAYYKQMYGGLYNWYAVESEKLCPTDWHVPSSTEWTTLINNLGGDEEAGARLKESGSEHWGITNGANNESGFTALPGGLRSYSDGSFSGDGNYGHWWTSTEYDNSRAWYIVLYYNSDETDLVQNKQNYGFSVRCIHD